MRVGKGLSADDAKEVADFISNHRSLQRVMLSGNNLGSHGADNLAPAIANSRISRVDFRHNSLLDEGATSMCDALSSSTYLRRLDLSGNSIGIPGSRGVSRLLAKSTSIERLDMRNNPIMDEGVAAMAAVLSRGTTGLRRVSVF